MQDLHCFGEPRIKIMALPKDTNAAGNIFGGWIMSQIDLAGSTAARELSPQRVVTISMKEIIFKEPVFIGDMVSCYARIIKVGNTSITTEVKVVAMRLNQKTKLMESFKVTTAIATYVSVDKDGQKQTINPELKKLHGF